MSQNMGKDLELKHLEEELSEVKKMTRLLFQIVSHPNPTESFVFWLKTRKDFEKWQFEHLKSTQPREIP